MNVQPANTNQQTTDARSLNATRAYSVPELAHMWATGARPLYRAIRDGRLKAARLNGRGDLRVTGAWAIAYLESCATEGAPTA